LLVLFLLDDTDLETFSSWDGNGWVLAISNDEDVADSGTERCTVGVLNVTDIVGTWMLLDGLENTDSTNIVSTGKIDSGTVDGLDDGLDLTVCEVDLERVILLDLWMWESDRSTVMGNNVWYLVLTNVLLDNFTKFERSFLSINSNRLESTLGIEKNSEMFVGFVNSEDVHLTKRESVFSSDLAINLDHTLSILADLKRILSVKSILKSLLKNNVKWNTISELMWTRCWSSTVNSLQFTKIPHLGSVNSFQNFSLSFIAHFVLDIN